MNAFETLSLIEKYQTLEKLNLKWCLVGNTKFPYKLDGNLVRPNSDEDFVSLDKIKNAKEILKDYTTLGISVQASNICVIDIDKCFAIPFDITSFDDRAKYALNLFKGKAYVEYSFSGTGLRILFYADKIENYKQFYYIKNSKLHIECYFPWESARYVTITGKVIYNNKILFSNKLNQELYQFINKYMLRDNNIYKIYNQQSSVLELADVLKMIRVECVKSNRFQDLWYNKAPGSGQNESEKDYQLLAYIFERITQDKDLMREAFESSPYYHSKDIKHIKKWEYNNHRYYDCIFDKIYSTHQSR